MNTVSQIASRKFRRNIALLLGISCLAAIAAPTEANVTLTGGGLVLAEEAGTFDAGNLSTLGGAYAFALDELGLATHFTANVRNGTYGNASSWIGNGATGTSGPFIGVGFGSSLSVQSIAFGRSNVTTGDPCGGGVCTDRNLGLYTLQYTNAPGANAATPDIAWLNVGTLNYLSAGGANFGQPHRRHRYNFTGVTATALRLIVPASGIGAGTAIDEIEVYQLAGAVTPPPAPVVLTPSPGFAIGFNGNNGVNFTPGNPAPVPNNLALASNGSTALGSSQLDFGVHFITNVNDGLYGNSNSWIADFANGDPAPAVGVAFPTPVNIAGIAFGRDNGNNVTDACGGQCTDRSLGTYRVQFTRIVNPDSLTPETGNPATGWADVGSIEYRFADVGFDPFLRHEFSLAESGGDILGATGVRIRVSDANIAIDEIEVIGIVVPEPGTIGTLAVMAAGLMTRRRRARSIA